MNERIHRPDNRYRHSLSNDSDRTTKQSSTPYYANAECNLSWEEIEEQDNKIFNRFCSERHKPKNKDKAIYSSYNSDVDVKDEAAPQKQIASISNTEWSEIANTDNYNGINTSNWNSDGKDSISEHQLDIDREQPFQKTTSEQTHLYVAFLPAIPVAIVGGFVLVAIGGVLLLQVEDENGELVTVNEYASRPIAELLEDISNDIKNYYQTADEVSKIKEWVAPALEKIVVTQEPDNQILTTPNGEQQTVEHTGSVPPLVETGTPPFDTESRVETPTHTGGQTQLEQDASDYVLESRRRDVQGHDDEGGHTDDRHISKADQWLRNRQRNDGIKNSSSFANNAAANLTQARFIKTYKKEIREWLNDKKAPRKFTKDIIMDRVIGTAIPGKGKARPTNKAKVVLLKDNSELGYHILTSFPVP